MQSAQLLPRAHQTYKFMECTVRDILDYGFKNSMLLTYCS